MRMSAKIVSDMIREVHKYKSLAAERTQEAEVAKTYLAAEREKNELLVELLKRNAESVSTQPSKRAIQ